MSDDAFATGGVIARPTSRDIYPQHLTREAIAEALINTPYGERLYEANVCDSVVYPSISVNQCFSSFPASFAFKPLHVTITVDTSALAAALHNINDALNRLTVLAPFDWIGTAPREPLPSNFADALEAKRRSDADKANRRCREAVKQGRRKRG